MSLWGAIAALVIGILLVVLTAGFILDLIGYIIIAVAVVAIVKWLVSSNKRTDL